MKGHLNENLYLLLCVSEPPLDQVNHLNFYIIGS